MTMTLNSKEQKVYQYLLQLLTKCTATWNHL